MTEETLFERAVQLPAAEQAAFFDRECAGQPELRGRVEALLAADAASHSLLDQPVAVPERTGEYTPSPEEPQPASRRATDPRSDNQAGAVIAGKYTLVEVIGEGGMGAVWRAKQTEPVKRFVAIKLIKVGMDSKQVLARFDAERQALALMDHPNIAKVLDGGLHDHRPFFVMELVKGVPITDYCDANKLMPKQRLELFVQACQAIQHAHQKGIIHRDIKPSNVLVALYDDKPVVKVIDFGVAKATGGALTEATIDTGFGGVVGTPQYMSPEQATFNNLDIDTRSDVYALGVLLYELLAGSPPFSGDELKKKGFLEILRVVREEEPPRPSTKLSTADALPSLSANRGTEPKKLTGLLRNELDWIVMKALEKDRTRRYETANGFAADVQRFLAGEPVVAHPPSMGYRLKKFVRRNKGQVIAASVVLVALLAGIAGTTWQWIAATNQRRKAETAEALARQNELKADDERKKALDEAQKAELARGQAEQESKRADRQRLEAETAKYAMQLKLADTHYENFELPAAHKILAETKQDLRNWEYDLVKQRCDGRMQFFGKERAYVAVAITPDGKLVAGGGNGGTVELFDYDTRELVAELRGSWSFVLQLAFSPDGKRLACATETAICVWDVATRKQLGKLEFAAPAEPKRPTNTLFRFARYIAFDAAGKRLALGLEEEIQIWDATLSKRYRTIKTGLGKVTSIAFDPVRDRIAVHRRSPEGDPARPGAPPLEVVLIYDVGSGDLHKQMNVDYANAPFVRYDPQGRWLLTSAFKLSAWDPETGNSVECPLTGFQIPDEGMGLSQIAISADGSRVATRYLMSSTMHVFDVKTGKLTRTLPMPEFVVDGARGTPITAIGMSADGRRLVAATAHMFSLGMGRSDVGRLVGVRIDGDSSKVDLKSKGRGHSWHWRDAALCEKAGWIARPISYPKHIIGQSIDYDLTNQKEHFLVEFHSLKTGDLLFCLRRHDREFGRLVASRDGQSLLEFHGATIEVWDPQTRRRTRTIYLENHRDQVQESPLLCPKDALLATVEGDKHADRDKQRFRLVVRDFRTGKILWETEPTLQSLEPRDFSADGSRLLISMKPPHKVLDPKTGQPNLDYKVKLKVFDTRTGEVLAETRQALQYLASARFLAPGRVCFSTRVGLEEWETATGEVTTVSDHPGPIHLIRNGTRMIVTFRGVLRVLDVATMQEVYQMSMNRIESFAASPSGNAIVIHDSNEGPRLLRILPSKE